MATGKERLVFTALLALFILILLYETLVFKPIPGGMMPHHMAMHGFMAGQTGPSLFGFNIVFWLLILALIYLFFKEPGSAAESEAVRILKERYAKGEISKEEYLETFKDLKEK